MIQPLSDRVLLKAIEKENITDSGIVLPESSNKERPFMYEIVAIGPGRKDIDMSVVQKGDKVLCGQYSGDEIKFEGQEYKVVGIEYILAVVK